MSDLATLESEITASIAAAADERALEDVRVAALGKKGAISERLKGLGKMAPEERKIAGAALNVLKDNVTASDRGAPRRRFVRSASTRGSRPRPST